MPKDLLLFFTAPKSYPSHPANAGKGMRSFFFNLPGYTRVKFEERQTVRSVAGYLCRHSSAFRLLLAQTASHSTARFKVGETERSGRRARERQRETLQPEESHEVTLQDRMHGPLPCKLCTDTH